MKNIMTQSAYIQALEGHNPRFSTDLSRWIPVGLVNDLVDNNIPPETQPVTDNCSGFTQDTYFSCMDFDITSIPQLKTRFLQKVNNAQQVQVNQLFLSYGY